MSISKRDSPEVPKEVELRFRSIRDNAFGQGTWRVSTNFADDVLMLLLVHSTHLRVEDDPHNEAL